MTRSLSAQQRYILTFLADASECPAWGVRWRVGGDAAWRASISRSLRRLESMGLVRRRNSRGGDRWIPPLTQEGAERIVKTFGGTIEQAFRDHEKQRPAHHGRATHVQLTAAGRELAERLTKESTEFVNQNGPGEVNQ